jgi:hypothetical protein
MTHVIFYSDNINWEDYIRQQQIGEGRGSGQVMSSRDDLDNKYFEGLRYMRGYGIQDALTSVGRFLLPIASNLMETAKGEAQQTLGNVTNDWIQGKPLLESVKEHGQSGLKKISQKVQQCGKGKNRKNKKQRKNVYLTPHPIGDLISEPITSGPNPILSHDPIPFKMRKKRKDYLDFGP